MRLRARRSSTLAQFSVRQGSLRPQRFGSTILCRLRPRADWSQKPHSSTIRSICVNFPRQPRSPGATRHLIPGSAAYGSRRRVTPATRLPSVGAPAAAIITDSTFGTRMRDGFAPRRITGGHPFAGIGTPWPLAGGTECSAPQWRTSSTTAPPRLGVRTSGSSFGPLRPSIGSASRSDHKISPACCPPIGGRLGKCLARHDHRKPDRGEAADTVLGRDSCRGSLPQRRANTRGDRPFALARRARLADRRRRVRCRQPLAANASRLGGRLARSGSGRRRRVFSETSGQQPRPLARG